MFGKNKKEQSRLDLIEQKINELLDENSLLRDDIDVLQSRIALLEAKDYTHPQIEITPLHVTYDPPCPRCGQDDHWNAGQGPCVRM